MRIIAGKFKGRTISTPKGLTTRPPTGRVKTALFNIINSLLPDAVVIDLFSGSGSLGIEAISRGARFCYFAEQDHDAISCLERNIRTLGITKSCRVWIGDIFEHLYWWLDEVLWEVNLVFIDPPFKTVAEWNWQQVQKKLFIPLVRKLSHDGIIILRCHRNILLPSALEPLYVQQRRDYGKMSLIFMGLEHPEEQNHANRHQRRKEKSI